MTEEEKQALVRQAMAVLGSARSERKTTAARLNAKASWTKQARKKRLAGIKSRPPKPKIVPTDGIKISPPAIP